MENKKINQQDREPASSSASATGAENRFKENTNRNAKDRIEENKAKLNGNKGRFETEHTEPTGEASALPGAEDSKDIGTAAAGAGLGGNKGTGTSSKKSLD